MTENRKLIGRAVIRCYLTTQITGLILAILFLLSRWPPVTRTDPSLFSHICHQILLPYIAGFCLLFFFGILVTVMPTLLFAVVLVLVSKAVCDRHVAWLSYPCSIAVTSCIFFATFPLISIILVPSRWGHSFPSGEDWIFLGLAMPAALAGTASLNRFWTTTTMDRAQPVSACDSSPRADTGRVPQEE